MPFDYGTTGTNSGGGGGSGSGNGIADIRFNEDSSLTIELDDGTEYTSPALKGADGADGKEGAPGLPGTNWFTGTAISGTETSFQTYPDSGVSLANAGDYYLNTDSGNVYRCGTGGDADTATWAYAFPLIGSVETAPIEDVEAMLDEIFVL